MTFLDWVVLGALGYMGFRGFRKGLVGQIFDLLGTILAVVGAFYFFDPLGGYVASLLHISRNLANVLGFILAAVLISVVCGFIARRWDKMEKSEAVTITDQLTGAGFGIIKALVFLIFIFMIMVSIPWNFTREPVRKSFLAQDVLRLTPAFYFLQEWSMPADVPRLMITPEGLQLRRFNYQELGGATCLACGGRVKYDGLQKKGIVSYPHFSCTRCGRVSDGCQTFEGYHLIYNRCPYEEKNDLECKVWANPDQAILKNRCSVCGRSR